MGHSQRLRTAVLLWRLAWIGKPHHTRSPGGFSGFALQVIDPLATAGNLVVAGDNRKLHRGKIKGRYGLRAPVVFGAAPRWWVDKPSAIRTISPQIVTSA